MIPSGSTFHRQFIVLSFAAGYVGRGDTAQKDAFAVFQADLFAIRK